MRPGGSGRARAALALLVAAALAVGGCGGGDGGGGGGAAPAGHPAPHPAGRAAPHTAASRGPGARTLALPVDRAVAQLFAVGFAGTDPRAPIVRTLRTRDWGVVVLDATNVRSPKAARALTRALVRAGATGGDPPPLLAADPAALPGVPPPVQAKEDAAPAARAGAAAAARALRGEGVRMALAPTVDLAVAAGPAADSAFSIDPAVVARLAGAAVAGYADAGVAAVPGHFPGQGSASQDPEQGVASVGLSLAALRQRDMAAFATVARTAPTLQLSDAVYSAFDGVTPAALLPQAYALLRRDLRFGGVAMTDDLTAATVATGGTVAQAAVRALRAGADLLYVPGDAAAQESAYQAVLAAVRRGEVPQARLAEALGRVQALKRRFGG